jgi:hypothetical protein
MGSQPRPPGSVARRQGAWVYPGVIQSGERYQDFMGCKNSLGLRGAWLRGRGSKSSLSLHGVAPEGS